MVLAWQLHRRRRAFPALHQPNQVAGPDGHRHGDHLPVAESAPCAHGNAVPREEVLELLEALAVELRLVATDRRDLLLESVADIDDEAAGPLPHFGVEGKQG